MPGQFLEGNEATTTVEVLKLYLKRVWLQAEVGTGRADVSRGADFAPTQAEREGFALLHSQLEQARAEFRKLYDATIPPSTRRCAPRVCCV